MLANQRWSLDFVHEQMASGRRFRVLNVVDDFSRECARLIAYTSISDARVGRELDAAVFERRARPQTIANGEGTGLTSIAILRWSEERNITWHHMAAGNPNQTGFIEQFNARPRDKLCDETILTSLVHARQELQASRYDYNYFRRRSSLGNRNPAEIIYDQAANFIAGMRPQYCSFHLAQRGASKWPKALLVGGRNFGLRPVTLAEKRGSKKRVRHNEAPNPPANSE